MQPACYLLISFCAPFYWLCGRKSSERISHQRYFIGCSLLPRTINTRRSSHSMFRPKGRRAHHTDDHHSDDCSSRSSTRGRSGLHTGELQSNENSFCVVAPLSTNDCDVDQRRLSISYSCRPYFNIISSSHPKRNDVHLNTCSERCSSRWALLDVWMVCKHCATSDERIVHCR